VLNRVNLKSQVESTVSLSERRDEATCSLCTLLMDILDMAVTDPTNEQAVSFISTNQQAVSFISTNKQAVSFISTNQQAVSHRPSP
jgi:hypothetical protein